MTLALRPVSALTMREFGLVFSKLALQLRFSDADTATIQSYYDALKDFTLPVMERTARGFAQEAGRRFFPTSGEWFAAALTAQQQQFKQAIGARNEPWTLECTDCEDTGWAYHDCNESNPCGRKFKHAPHTYVSICPCRGTNRTYQRHQVSGFGA